ncbi:NTP transferase domain-containing protein [Roseibium aggregatum]|uniref:NTP transferase domain-containing protein n=1 Tax=Roseibium aggregatum TaxID=187304 RepID=A0A926P284_9HYPH|nr:molybdopterin-binding/glycosyltransferase family 2 protein [Roseibium aggregatum]MBD1547723.1 NTP transferase domain-containing protein [Roseibium aggregatum]
MEFGPRPVLEAEGCVLAHSTRTGNGTFKKGRVLSADDVRALAQAGIASVTVACLAADDLSEDVAADRIAQAANGGGLTGDAPFTGRVNLYADQAGVLVIDRQAIDAMNRIDPAITIATLPEYARVQAGRMVATAKIIPFAVSGRLVEEAEKRISKALKVAPFKAHRIGLVATRLPHLKPSTMDKTRRVLEARLGASGSTILAEERVDHREEAVAEAMARLADQGADFLILFGASAVVDRKDILPAAIERAGGTVEQFGMPVDPGNLLMIGTYKGLPVIGAPGCARSPKENGFDWVLERKLAGLDVSAHDITGMGVGGLLMEIGTRPQPREVKTVPDKPKIGAIILAAGKSSRMGGPNKLLAEIGGKSLVRHAAEAAQGADLGQTVLVTGHMAEKIGAEVSELGIDIVHNPDFADGMAGSILTGMEALDPSLDAVIILLADMPGITSDTLKGMIERYSDSPDALIVTATADGKRGNPVLWDKRFFEALKALHGDIGARHLIAENPEFVLEYEIGSAARLDLDTPEALARAGGKLLDS